MTKQSPQKKIQKQRVKADFLFEGDRLPTSHCQEDLSALEVIMEHGVPDEVWYKGNNSTMSGLLFYKEDAYWIPLKEKDVESFRKNGIKTESYEDLRKRVHRL